jgi:hypothetical protein
LVLFSKHFFNAGDVIPIKKFSMKKLFTYVPVFAMAVLLSCENDQEISASEVPQAVTKPMPLNFWCHTLLNLTDEK